MERREEVRTKKGRLARFLGQAGLDGVVFSRVSNFSWFTAGGSDAVAQSSEIGPAHIFFDGKRSLLITDNIEAPRLRDEELLQGEFELVSVPWSEGKGATDALKALGRGKKVASDTPLGPPFKKLPESFYSLRCALLQGEIERFRKLGRLSAQALQEVAFSVKPGQTEFEVAGILAGECWKRGISPIVVLVAADDRISRYRHPTPTSRRIRKRVMIVLCGRRWGLVSALTRIVSFGKVPKDLQRRHEAVCIVDTALITSALPGRSLGEALLAGLEAYRETGFPDEWRKHHQGGLIGYEPRERKALPDDNFLLAENMALAWNPSITGTKSEDTFLILSEGLVNITRTPKIPTLAASWKGRSLRRSAILER